jgi:hypothetical protein
MPHASISSDSLRLGLEFLRLDNYWAAMALPSSAEKRSLKSRGKEASRPSSQEFRLSRCLGEDIHYDHVAWHVVYNKVEHMPSSLASPEIHAAVSRIE